MKNCRNPWREKGYDGIETTQRQISTHSLTVYDQIDKSKSRSFYFKINLVFDRRTNEIPHCVHMEKKN